MGGKKATSTSQVTIPPEVMARYNAINARAETAASKPFQAFGSNPADYVAQMNEQQALGTGTINRSGGPAYAGIENYMSPYTKNVADTTGAYMRQQQEQAQSGALGTAAMSGAFGGDRAGIAAANLQQQNSMAYGKTMADIMNQGYTQALGASQADLNRGLQAGQTQLAAGTMQQQTEQAGKDAMINRFMQEQGLPYQQAQFLANIALGTGTASGSTTTSTQPVGFFQNLATGGKVDGYAEGGGVAGPVSHSKEAIGGVGYVPEPNLPVGQLMIAQPPEQSQDDGGDKIAQILAMIGGGKKDGGAIGSRHGYVTGGTPSNADRTWPEYLDSLNIGPKALDAAKELGIRSMATGAVPAGLGVGFASQIGGLAAGAAGYPETGNSMVNFGNRAYDFAGNADKDIFSSAADREQRRLGRLQMLPQSSAAPTSDFRPPLTEMQPDISYGQGNVDPRLARAAMQQVSPPINPPGGVDSMVNPRPVNPQGGVDAMLYQANAGPHLDPTGAVGVGLPPRALSARPGDFKAQSMDRYMDNAPTADQRPMPRPEGLGVAAIGTPVQDANLATMGETGVVAPVGQTAPDYRRQVAKVLGGGKGYTDVEYTDGTRDRVVGNLNIRNNNPGNIEFGDLAQKYGAVGTDGRFAVFPDYETGRKAQEALLFESGVYSGKTIGSAIAKYAPAGDGNNNPAAYANSVAAALGVPVNTPLAALNPEQRSAMLTAMEKVEGGGGPSTYSTTPLDSSGAPIPLQNYGGGLAAGAFGNDKPYEERNALGKFFYKPEGGLDRNSVLSALSGLGAMASSRSMSPFTAALQGLGAGADTYKGLLKQNAEVTGKNIESVGHLYDLYNKFQFSNPEYANTTLKDFADANGLGYLLPTGSQGQMADVGATSSGMQPITMRDTQAYVDTMVDGKKVSIPFMSDYASLSRLAAQWKNAPDGSPQRAAALKAEEAIKAIDANGYTTGFDEQGQPVVVPVDAARSKMGATVTDQNNIENTQIFRSKANEIVPTIGPQIEAIDRQANIYSKTEAGALASTKGTLGALASALGINIDNFNDAQQAALVQEALKEKARGIMTRGGGSQEATDFARSFIDAGSAGPNLEPDAVKKLLVIEKASLMRERDRLERHREWQGQAQNPYDLNEYESWFAKNYPLENFIPEAEKDMPMFVGETGSFQKPHVLSDTFTLRDVPSGHYVQGSDGAIRGPKP